MASGGEDADETTRFENYLVHNPTDEEREDMSQHVHHWVGAQSANLIHRRRFGER